METIVKRDSDRDIMQQLSKEAGAKSRLRLHWHTWMWIIVVTGAFVVVNSVGVPYRMEGSWSHGWPSVWFARAPSYSAIAVDGARVTYVSLVAPLINIPVWLFILLGSTYSVEKFWRRSSVKPRFRLIGLIAFIGWMASTKWFFDEVLYTEPPDFWAFTRIRDWALFIVYIGAGLCWFTSFDLVGEALKALRKSADAPARPVEQSFDNNRGQSK